jgi:hypothetical protein
MIDTNLALIREQEQARVNIFLSKEEEPENLEYQLDMAKMAKGDCEILTDSLIAPYISGEEQNGGGRVAPQELHCKTPIKTKMKCRKGKNKEFK